MQLVTRHTRCFCGGLFLYRFSYCLLVKLWPHGRKSSPLFLQYKIDILGKGFLKKYMKYGDEKPIISLNSWSHSPLFLFPYTTKCNYQWLKVEERVKQCNSDCCKAGCWDYKESSNFISKSLDEANILIYALPVKWDKQVCPVSL